MLLGTASERLVFRAHVTDDGILLAGDVDDIDELLGYVERECDGLWDEVSDVVA